jgi:hypothetical protein
MSKHDKKLNISSKHFEFATDDVLDKSMLHQTGLVEPKSYGLPYNYKKCHHNGAAAIELSCGRTIGGASSRANYVPGKTHLIVDCASDRFSYTEFKLSGRANPLSKLIDGRDWMSLRWEDGCAPQVKPGFWKTLIEQLSSPGDHIVFTCVGGHGRTGTAMAGVLIEYCGMDPIEAVSFIRDKYCSCAVETAEQEQYLAFLPVNFEVVE